MTDVLVTSYQTGGSGDLPTDSFSLNFAKVKIEYVVQKRDGSVGESVSVDIDKFARRG